MKEASGELNMTVVTVLAIAAIGAFFYLFVWPALQGNISKGTKCANAVCTGTCSGKVQSCTYYPVDTDGQTSGSPETIQCPCEE